LWSEVVQRERFRGGRKSAGLFTSPLSSSPVVEK
jgi:hypothetical protein